MGRDNHPRNRQKRHLERKEAITQQFERILIVSEGSKTEPNYFSEIMQYYRIPTAIYRILPSQTGTSPKQVVEFARDLFLNGEPQKKIKKRAFERVYALFDRDNHASYHQALELAKKLNKTLINDEGEKVQFRSIVSIPSFELWFLLHFKLVHGSLSHRDALRQLKEHMPNYEKGNRGCFEQTRSHLSIALANSKKLIESADPYDGNMPYTDIGSLVEYLSKIKE